MIINMEALSYFFTMMLMPMKKLLRCYSLGQKNNDKKLLTEY